MSDLDRRAFLEGVVAAGAIACADPAPAVVPDPNAVIGIEPLGRSPWKTDDPFLFCAWHNDAYPKGNPQMGPAASLAGRQLGRDFSGKDAWSMYHGRIVPGFPRHPHRGFETITVTRTGYVDHSDSLGATARYGEGDAQWMTAGDGIVHAEMFPLRVEERDNPLKLFQIWLNLPAASKRVKPHFSMFWKETIPEHRIRDAAGKTTRLVTIAGAYEGKTPPKPPPASWASKADSHVAVWTLDMEPGARFVLPEAAMGVSRNLYFHAGSKLTVGSTAVGARQRIRVSEKAVEIVAGPDPVEVLLLQGKPIGEPVAKQGPFVMNTRAELQQAYADYRRTGFGGWPWPDDAPVHPRGDDRFAIHADGRKDKPA